MFRSILRVFGAALFLIVVGAGAMIAYFWADASSLMTRADDKGWLPPANDAPLSTFETTLAKAEFGETWDHKVFPCRSVSRAWSALTGGQPTGQPVSQLVSREFRYDLHQDFGALGNGVRQTALACVLESKLSDTQLLRIWVGRLFLSRNLKSAEEASSTLFGKPLNQLDETQSAKLVALIRSPALRDDQEHWDRETASILARLAQQPGPALSNPTETLTPASTPE